MCLLCKWTASGLLSGHRQGTARSVHRPGRHPWSGRKAPCDVAPSSSRAVDDGPPSLMAPSRQLLSIHFSGLLHP